MAVANPTKRPSLLESIRNSLGHSRRTGATATLDTITLFLFTIAIFASATLLFVVQPMVGKILLPMLGGSPSVWNTCMVFFQAVLLAGYLLAHLMNRWVPLKIQAILFPAALLLAFQTLPIAVGTSWTDELLAGAAPTWWLLKTLGCTVAPVFLVMSMTSPLLQQWFSKSKHSHAGDPYFLYAASNVGSILALLAYPLVIEANLGVSRQTGTWMWGFAVFGLLAAGCGITSWLGSRRLSTADEVAQSTTNTAVNDRPVTWQRRANWVLLAFVPSSLMLGVTTYVSTDVSSIPLIWVIPLTLYLLTFVLAFASRQLVSSYWAGRIAALLTVVVTVTVVTGANHPQSVIVPLHLILFFFITLFCHQRLANDRPAANHLTDFYLWLSVGGVLGGLVNALLAPALFTTIIEYPLVMVLASCLRPTKADQATEASPPNRWTSTVLFAIAIFAAIVGLGQAAEWVPADWYQKLDNVMPLAAVRLQTLLVFGIPAVFVLQQLEKRARFSFGLLAILLVSVWNQYSDANVMAADRNFYGTIRTERDTLAGGAVIRQFHGNTVHGWQWTDEARRRVPLTYYGRSSGIGQVIAHQAKHRQQLNIGAIGLGAGTLAATLRPGDSMCFYEINPQVVDHAEQHFTYLQDARDVGATLTTKVGDARLVLEAESRSDNNFELFDVLAVDAFSSDSIPVHLLTQECLQIYLSRLKPDGIIAFHVTNRYINLEPVIAALAIHNDLAGWSYHFRHATGREFDETTGEMASSWLLLAKTPAAFAGMEDAPDLRPLVGRGDARLWTDEYSNVIGALEF